MEHTIQQQQESISIFNIFKIGIGPSSSHTLGPWVAVLRFLKKLQGKKFNRIQVHLFGSLSKTGKGHATDTAIQLGLQGFDFETFEVEKVETIIKKIKETNSITVLGKNIPFTPEKDIIFENSVHPSHPNTLTIKAFDKSTKVIENSYLSIGGGFVEELHTAPKQKKHTLKYPINKSSELLKYTREKHTSISNIVYENELCLKTSEEIDHAIKRIFDTMVSSIHKGCMTKGTLPGGLNVSRRAKRFSNSLLKTHDVFSKEEWISKVKNSETDFSTISKWISCFALAVNEENASLGRIVTSPTNGAAGVVPAVIFYYYCFNKDATFEKIKNFFLTSGEIGCMFKKGATISAALGGCQAEIGVSSAMAAGGLTEILGGTPEQVLMAAEITMEHHLGLTCDPVSGLVQIPCIERNTMGAIKAITAANLAITGNPEKQKVDFDTIVKTMWETAKDMNNKYKETAEGGLAVNLSVNIPNC